MCCCDPRHRCAIANAEFAVRYVVLASSTMHAKFGIYKCTISNGSSKGYVIMTRALAANSFSIVLAVGFIGCSGTEAPKSSAPSDCLMKGDGMMKDDKMMKDVSK